MNPIHGNAVNHISQTKIQQSSLENTVKWNQRSVKTAQPKSHGFKGKLVSCCLALKNRRVKLPSGASVKRPDVRTIFAQEEKSAPKKATNTSAASGHKNDKTGMDSLIKEGKRILSDLKELNTSKKEMQNLPFNSSSRREASLDINLKKRQVKAEINRFNDKAQAAGNTHITLDMRTIEMGLLNQGNQFLENNEALKPFL